MIVVIVACDKLVTKDDPQPTAIELNPIICHDSTFTISWPASEDDDFKSYTLYEALVEDLSDEDAVFESSERQDTNCTRSELVDGLTYYYRLVVANTHDNTASSSSREGPADCLHGQTAVEQLIAFTSDRTGSENIYLMDIYGRNQREIINLPEYNCSGCGTDCDEWTPLIEASTPLFHPDGDRILFQGLQETYGDRGIFITNLDGSVVSQRYVRGPGCCSDIEFSLTGDAYYFISGLGAIWRVNTASCSGNYFPYSLNTEQSFGFSVSPDGNYIAFHSCYITGSCKIIIADVDFAYQPTQIRGPNDLYQYYYPVFTPDSEALICYMRKPTGADGLFRMMLDGTNQVPLDTTINSIQQVQIAPDGSRILFRRRVSGTWGLYTMDLNGSDQTLLANTTGKPENFQYSSDGQYICFDASVSSQREVFIMNADGSSLAQLTTEGGYSPVLQPRE
jgi:Tol biopolymer transport system component